MADKRKNTQKIKRKERKNPKENEITAKRADIFFFNERFRHECSNNLPLSMPLPLISLRIQREY